MAKEHELNIIRDRQAAFDARLDRAEEAPVVRAARRLVQVYNGGDMPVQPDRVYLAHPVELDGDELEGGPASLNVDLSVAVPVVVLWGPAQAGDVLLAHAVGGRWVSERRGPGLFSVPCDACRIPGTLYLTDSHTTTVLKFVDPAPAWVLSETGNAWSCQGAWIGCYSLLNQLVASGCATPPYPAPYIGESLIRYALGFCGASCTIHVRRLWGTTGLVTSPSGFAYVDCAPTSNCDASSTTCRNDAMIVNWQVDSYDAALTSCAPFPVSAPLNCSEALPGNPLTPSVVIDA